MWQWYRIFNLNDFDALSVPDYTFSIELEGKGFQTFRIIKGLLYSVIVDGIFLTPFLNGRNGFEKDNKSAYIDEDNNLWVGYAPET
ncbi:MAG: hypothetical protein LBD46_06575 [Endomicrobium sp.]|jgi:hypothetical protein|nr:hypothetical protein [Endomicrobium sp.]